MNPDTGELKMFSQEEPIPKGWLDCTPGRTLEVTSETGHKMKFRIVDVNLTERVVRIKLDK